MPDPDERDLPDATPCGVVQAVGGGATSVVLDRVDRLLTGDRVRLADKSSGNGPLAYVKLGQAGAVELFEDAALARPAQLPLLQPGSEVIRLAQDDWAVVLALNHYLSPTIRELKGAREDARQFERWVKQVACVPDDQVKMVPSAETPIAEPMQAIPTLEIAFAAFSDLGKNKPPGKRWGRRLYIFCSGHGIMPLQGSLRDYREAALLMASASLDNNYGLHIPTRGCAEYFRASGLFREVILLLDCCRDLKNNVSLSPIMLRAVGNQLTVGRQFYAIPTEIGEKTYEKEVGEPAAWRGVFSYKLIDALNDPTLCDDQGVLTGSLLRDRIYNMFQELGDAGEDGQQSGRTPPIDYDPQQTELKLLRRRGFRAPTMAVEFDVTRAGELVQLWGWGAGRDGKVTLIVTEPVGEDGVWRVEVGENKLYKVVDATGASKLIESKGAATYERFS